VGEVYCSFSVISFLFSFLLVGGGGTGGIFSGSYLLLFSFLLVYCRFLFFLFIFYCIFFSSLLSSSLLLSFPFLPFILIYFAFRGGGGGQPPKV
jgi:hypothetical protein